MTTRRILIAGITGFLGSRLAQELVRDREMRVVGLHRTGSNLDRLVGIRSKIELFDRDEQNLDSLFQTHRIDIIINCLADYGRSETPAALEANLELPTELLELGVRHAATLFFNAGTSLPATVNSYASTKHEFSNRLRKQSKKLVAVDARLEHFYGGGESEDRFISYLITQFLKPVEQLDLTKGEQRRDFLYIEDVLRAICLSLKAGLYWQPGYYEIPIGSGHAYLIREVVEMVRRLTSNRQTRINYGAVPYRENEAMFSRADTRKLEKLGWRPRWALEDGLRYSVEWHRRNFQGRKAS